MTAPAADRLDPRLTSLANRPADVSLGAIWKALTRSERADAVRTGFDDPNSSVATWAIDQVARAFHRFPAPRVSAVP